MAGDINTSSSTRRRVKLYMLNEDRQWDDRGTGHVSSVYIERLKGMSLLVRSETDGSILLESKIQQDTAYQKQQETLIVWSEAENNYDLALSFQDKSGCDEIWEKICAVQGKDPSVDITQDIVEESEDERFDDISDGSNPIELPPCELSKLDEISELFSSSVTSPIRREKLAVAIETDSYIKKLLDLFHICEDLEDLVGLHQLFAIFKNIFLLNKHAVFEVMFTDDCILDIIGVLEYDPSLEHPIKHREYLLHGTHYRDVIPMTKSEIERKIHQTYRVQYIHDVILPMPSVFEENMLSALSSFIFFNKVEIVSVLQEDEKFLTSLFAQLMDDETTDPKRLDLILFLKEFCSFSQTLQPHSRDAFFKTLSNLGILSVIEIILGLDDENVKGAAVDIFSCIVEYSPSMVREFILREGQSTADDEDILINLVIEQMINDTDPELGGAMQLMGLLRLLIDPENMLATANKTEKTEFLSFFYKHSLHVLTAPLFAVTTEEKPSNDDYQTAQLLGLILELITFCVEHHTYHIKNYVINKDLLRRVLVLLKSKHAFLALSALRFMRKIIGLKEDFYNRYIIKGNLFQPVIDAYLTNASRYNLKNSAMIEMFEFIRTEDIKSFILHIVESYDMTELGAYDCVDTFKALKLRQEQQLERLKDKANTENAMSVLRNNRYRRDARMLDEEEEMYFDQDDDLDTNVPAVADILNIKLDAALDSDFENIKFMDNKKVTRDSDTNLEATPPRLINQKSPININLKSPIATPLVTPVTSPQSPLVPVRLNLCVTPQSSPDVPEPVNPKARIIGGLVDYPDEDSDEEEDEDGTPSKRPRLST